jgi:serine/threonine-protein kinase
LVQQVHAALERDPQLKEAHALLAEVYRSRAEDAEARRHADDLAENLALLSAHDQGEHTAWIQGTGSMTLHVETEAWLRLRPLRTVDRRLEAQAVVFEGSAPWINHPIEPGSYLIEVEVKGRPRLDLPVFVERQTVWSHGPPADPHRPLRVPEYIPPTAVLMPAGWCISGGDPMALDGLARRRIWIDGLFVQRHPVTNAEYIEFLQAIHQDDPVAALRYMPVEEGGVSATPRPMYRVDEAGRYHLGEDGIGNHWQPGDPVVSIDWHSAKAYAAWFSRRTGRHWRLPHALEWEKAARGVDGRFLPWGDHFEPTWTRALGSVAGEPGRVLAATLVKDVSIYGVHGMAGNVRDWCANAFLRAPPADESVLNPNAPMDPFRAVRGGSMLSSPAFCRPATRFGAEPFRRRGSVGFRLVSSVSG